LSFYKPSKGDKVPIAKQIFNFDSYLGPLKEAKRWFMEEMMRTQMAATFIEKSYAALHSHNEISYFVHGVRTLQSISKHKLEEELDNIYKVCMQKYRKVRFDCNKVASSSLVRRLL